MPPAEEEASATTPSRGISWSGSWSPAPRRVSTSPSAPTASPRSSPRSSSRSTAPALNRRRERLRLGRGAWASWRAPTWTRRRRSGSRSAGAGRWWRPVRWCSRRCLAGRSAGGRCCRRGGSSGASRGTAPGRQIMQHDEPIEVKIYQWNTGGLLTRIEGLRGFLPKFELMDRISTFADLKNKVGRSIGVCITRLNEETNDLIISEKKAWEMTYLKEGTLLQGTVRKIFPYGAQVRIAGTNRCGLLHISNISRGRVLSACDILKIDDEVKVLVIKSNVPDKIALSIGYLESAPGLFLSDKAKVFSEAEEMAKRYREQLPVISQNTKLDDGLPGGTIPFDDEATLYANWKWFKFLQHSKPGDDSNGT
ncbi:protein PIGMENT DEFECTIVE 338, chloroplastic-like isoform X4 [Phragmites australis]|uniref:protein PIGMENT DEFECTIVE 338, chloroplastic-like isoform X4 n=1 Tax=Phragmites australis TaxID=29695 RepID=UPI002D773673|nr:protein PIGMENT DEFECTIVE 338, chloroplastic-like isoform X4 [Phragmites australis]